MVFTGGSAAPFQGSSFPLIVQGFKIPYAEMHSGGVLLHMLGNPRKVGLLNMQRRPPPCRAESFSDRAVSMGIYGSDVIMALFICALKHLRNVHVSGYAKKWL